MIRADVPGVDPKNIEITMSDNLLTIRGEKETETWEEKEGFVRVERSKGTFCRQFSLPETIDAEKDFCKEQTWCFGSYFA